MIAALFHVETFSFCFAPLFAAISSFSGAVSCVWDLPLSGLSLRRNLPAVVEREAEITPRGAPSRFRAKKRGHLFSFCQPLRLFSRRAVAMLRLTCVDFERLAAAFSFFSIGSD
jgi:hypothetical protein